MASDPEICPDTLGFFAGLGEADCALAGAGLADNATRSVASAPNPIAPRRITGASSSGGHESAT